MFQGTPRSWRARAGRRSRRAAAAAEDGAAAAASFRWFSSSPPSPSEDNPFETSLRDAKVDKVRSSKLRYEIAIQGVVSHLVSDLDG